MSHRASHRDPETYAIIGAAMAVHRELGHGFLESVYQEALTIELQTRGVPAEREVALPIRFRSTTLAKQFRVDFVCFRRILVELKATQRLTWSDEAQVINYLKASGLELALLFNFGTLNLQYRRLIFTQPQSVSSRTDSA